MRILENKNLVNDDPEIVTVVLRQSDVDSLLAICGNVGGHPDETHRGVMSNLADILSPYGVNSYNVTGTIYFLD